MEIYPHNNYEEYVRLQRNLTEKKTDKGTMERSWINRTGIENVNRILHEFCSDIRSIVCHGCRSGLEVDQLRWLNPKAVVYGTDFYDGYRYDKTYFRAIDFDHVPEEWVGYFDVVYSNSIDHSRDPIKTLLAWRSELREGGIIFVSFYWGRGPSKEDCFQLDRKRPLQEISGIADMISMNISYWSSRYIDQYGNNVVDIIFKKG